MKERCTDHTFFELEHYLLVAFMLLTFYKLEIASKIFDLLIEKASKSSIYESAVAAIITVA